MRTEAIALTITGFVLGTIFGYFVLGGQQVAQVSSLKVQVSSLESQMEVLTAQRDSLITRSNQLDLQIVQLNAKIVELNAIYSFTLDSIGDAIVGAYMKGIDVKVVFEKSPINTVSEIFRLEGAGIPVRNDTNPAMMHHKVAIIDGSIVPIRSFNWSPSADEDHNEDLLVIRSNELASAFEQKFRRIWDTGM